MKVREEMILAVPVVYMRRVGAYGEQNYKLMQAVKDWVKSKPYGTKTAPFTL